MKKSAQFIDGIVELLVDMQAIPTDEAESIKKEFHDSDANQFDEFLMDEGLVEPHVLLDAISQYYKTPAFEVVSHFFDSHLLRKFPKSFLLQANVIPLEDDESTLIMVAANPSDSSLLPAIGEYVSYDIQFKVGFAREIEDAIKEFYDSALTEGMAPNIFDEPKNEMKEKDELESAEEMDETFVRYQTDDEEDDE